jgi:hypothetical protein
VFSLPRDRSRGALPDAAFVFSAAINGRHYFLAPNGRGTCSPWDAAFSAHHSASKLAGETIDTTLPFWRAINRESERILTEMQFHD